MTMRAFRETFGRLLRADGQSRSAKTVEVFGWLILAEGTLMLLRPDIVVSLLRLPPLVEQAENMFRLVGLLAGGVGMLYVTSGRLDARGFVFASLLDRPLVPPIMALLWYFEILPGPLAAAFAFQDFASFLWTLRAWSAEESARRA